MRVFTSQGLKKLEDVKEGDEVLTHKERFREVKDIVRVSEEGITIEVKRFHSCSLPETQKVYIFDDEFDWKEAILLKPGMRMVIPCCDQLKQVDHGFFGELPELETDFCMDKIREDESIGKGQHKILKVKEDNTYVTTSGTLSSERGE